MTRNLGTADRAVRAALAVALLAAAFVLGLTTPGGVAALVVAAVMLATSAVAFCPLYHLFGMSSCRRAGSD